MHNMVCIWTTWACDIDAGASPGARQSARAALRQLRRRIAGAPRGGWWGRCVTLGKQMGFTWPDFKGIRGLNIDYK